MLPFELKLWIASGMEHRKNNYFGFDDLINDHIRESFQSSLSNVLSDLTEVFGMGFHFFKIAIHLR